MRAADENGGAPSGNEIPIAPGERRSSAPDRMDANPEFEQVETPYNDVRLDPHYAKFYNSYQGDQKIPPPLEVPGGTSIMGSLRGQGNNSAEWPMPQDVAPPSPDSLSSMSFSLGHRMAMNCLDSPHLSPMSGLMSPQLMPSPNPTMIPSRQQGGISLAQGGMPMGGMPTGGMPTGGIPNADTWSRGWGAQQPPPDVIPYGQTQNFASTVAPQTADGEVVIGGQPYHVVPHQQWIQMMGQQQGQQQQMPMPFQQTDNRNHNRNSKGKGRNNRNNRRGKGKGHGNRQGNNHEQSFNNAVVPENVHMQPYDSIDDVVGKMHQLSKDQLGCRFLQKCIEEEPHVADVIFAEIEPHFSMMMTDPFGNYLSQKLMESCSPPLRSRMVELLSEDLANICFDSHGTRAVQRLITILGQANVQQSEPGVLMEALQPSLIALVRNLNGNHVVQACLQHFSCITNRHIFETVTGNCVLVATQRHGCCVMQRCIDYGNPEQRESLIAEIVNKTLLLVQDPYGNYVIQYVLDLKAEWIQSQVFGLLTDHFVKLSMGKFSSNVVEKCLVLLPQEAVGVILKELAHPDCIAGLLRDSYANYVIQKAVMLEHPSVLELVLSIKPHLRTLKDTAYGKKLSAKLHKKFGLVISDESTQ